MGETLFELGAEPHHKHAQAADATRRTDEFCWTDCTYCGITKHREHERPEMRAYRNCFVRRDVPQPTFVFSRVCEHYLPTPKFKRPVETTEPTSTYWDDY